MEKFLFRPMAKKFYIPLTINNTDSNVAIFTEVIAYETWMKKATQLLQFQQDATLCRNDIHGRCSNVFVPAIS
jgi:hypothetical protein